MPETNKIDVAIIGAGTAGLSARAEVAKQTDSYRVFEGGPLGTTCARVGCMPSKALIQVANDYHRRHVFADMGIAGGGNLSVDGAQVMRSVRRLRDSFVDHVIDGLDPWRDTHLIESPARFEADGTLVAGDLRFRARRTVIATGTSPIVPDGWRQVLGDRIITTDDIFELEDLPRRLGVVGLGPVGLELGQAMARLGVEVTGVDVSRELGGLGDEVLQGMAVGHFGKEFDIAFGEAEPEPADGGVRLTWEGGSAEVDLLLVAIGRRPNLEDLNFEALGISTGDDGIPEFDRHTQRIAGSALYIAGDVSGALPVLHEAADGGRIAGWNAARETDQTFRRRVPLLVSFTEPQIAHIGESPDALEDKGETVVTGSAGFDNQGRARLARKNAGCVRIHVRQSDGLILGADLFAPEAEHFAHLLAKAMEEEGTVQALLRMPIYHPTLEEGLRSALRDAAKQTTAGLDGIAAMRCEDVPVDC